MQEYYEYFLDEKLQISRYITLSLLSLNEEINEVLMICQ